MELPFGFNELECVLLIALFVFVAWIIRRAIRGSGGGGGGNGPRWGE